MSTRDRRTPSSAPGWDMTYAQRDREPKKSRALWCPCANSSATWYGKEKYWQVTEEAIEQTWCEDPGRSNNFADSRWLNNSSITAFHHSSLSLAVTATQLIMSSDADALETPVDIPKKQKKLRPARKQVKPGDVEKKEAPQTGKEYNIWYNKWAGGDREDSYSNKVKSQTRCHIKKDAGMTRANMTGVKYCCLFFARGCCPYGWEC
ncbi:predicted protein, partial [Postia placenta Mad-698-R]